MCRRDAEILGGTLEIDVRLVEADDAQQVTPQKNGISPTQISSHAVVQQ